MHCAFCFPGLTWGTYFQMERLDNPNTLTLTAGDAFGASVPLSNFFNEAPAVLSMNLMGFDVDTFGNHNFDRGVGHLQQMIDLAEFQYVSANLKDRDDNLAGVKDFEIFNVGGVKVGVIGITNPEAPTLVFPGRFGTIKVTDPIPAANKAKAQAKRAGAKVLVAITHLGVAGFDAEGNCLRAADRLRVERGWFRHHLRRPHQRGVRQRHQQRSGCREPEQGAHIRARRSHR